MTYRQFLAYVDAAQRRLHNEHAYQWQLTSVIVQSWTGKPLKDYPDYAGSEDEYDPEWIEAQLSAHPLVRRVDNRPAPVQ